MSHKMTLHCSHKWMRTLTKTDYARANALFMPQALCAPDTSSVRCDVCGCPDGHQHASEPCPGREVFRYLPLEDGSFIAAKVERGGVG